MILNDRLLSAVKCHREPALDPSINLYDPSLTIPPCKHCENLKIPCMYTYQPKKRGPPNQYLKSVDFCVIVYAVDHLFWLGCIYCCRKLTRDAENARVSASYPAYGAPYNRQSQSTIPHASEPTQRSFTSEHPPSSSSELTDAQPQLVQSSSFNMDPPEPHRRRHTTDGRVQQDGWDYADQAYPHRFTQNNPPHPYSFSSLTLPPIAPSPPVYGSPSGSFYSTTMDTYRMTSNPSTAPNHASRSRQTPATSFPAAFNLNFPSPNRASPSAGMSDESSSFELANLPSAGFQHVLSDERSSSTSLFTPPLAQPHGSSAEKIFLQLGERIPTGMSDTESMVGMSDVSTPRSDLTNKRLHSIEDVMPRDAATHIISLFFDYVRLPFFLCCFTS